MFFVIENCSPENYKNDTNRQLALTNILRSHGRRTNIVSASRRAMQSLIDSNLYGDLEKRFASDVIDVGREVGNLKNMLAVHTIVDFNSTSASARFDLSKRAIVAGYLIFTDVDTADAINFIAENDSDFNFYCKMAEYYSRYIFGFDGGLTTKLRFCLGAGSHSKSQFDRLEAANRFCLCIVDSDKKHPKRGEGETSAAFSVQNRSYHGTAIASVLDNHREAECIIPFAIVEDVIFKLIPTKKELLLELKEYYKKNVDFRKYFDFKNGITLKEAIELDEKYGNFWLDILGVNEKFSRKQCFSDRACGGCSSCPKVEGVSEDLLGHSVAIINAMHLRHLNNKLDTDLLPEWNRLGHLIMSWGCVLNSTIRSS